MKTNALAFRVALTLGLHPGSSLTLAQIVERFHADPDHDRIKAWGALQSACQRGILAKSVVMMGSRRMAVYSAGPELLRIVGSA